MSRLAELSAQYATVEEILEQPSPLPQTPAPALPAPLRPCCPLCHGGRLHDPPPASRRADVDGRRGPASLPACGELWRGLWGRAADAGQTAVAHHLAGVAEGVARPWIGAQLAVPLQGAGTLIGLLAVDSDQPAPFLPRRRALSGECRRPDCRPAQPRRHAEQPLPVTAPPADATAVRESACRPPRGCRRPVC